MANNDRTYSEPITGHPMAAEIASRVCNIAMDAAACVDCPPAEVLDAIKFVLDGIPADVMARMRETGERLTFEIEPRPIQSGRA